MLPTAPFLQLKDVTRQFDAASGSDPLTVLKGIDLEVGAGESLAVVGPSGSGKSTLLQIIGTLDQPTGGQVLFGGEDISQLHALDLAAVRNRLIGFVFQAHYLLPQCTVLENVLVPTLATSRRREEADSKNVRLLTSAATGESTSERARRLLKRVGLGPRLDHFPRQLSGGESQRVAVVRALINSPRLLLADEPTGSLDHAAALSLTQLLVEINKEEGVTLIIVTHSRELAKQMGRVLELEDGKWKVQ
jgi:lipoprotein-releasing system ATP-binding protein